MGLHSFLYADAPGDRMICGKCKDSYLLIPKEFGGGSIKEHCYQGYFRMGGVDVFEELAKWNKLALGKEISLDVTLVKMPLREDYTEGKEGDEDYRNACMRFREDFSLLFQFFSNKSDAYMVKHYGKDYLRNIGILLFERNSNLKYPLKITLKDAVYEEVSGCSDADPLQGCY